MLMGQLLFAFLIVNFFILDVAQVNGRSMEPTYTDGQLFIVNKITYLVGPPDRFEVVQLIDPTDEKKLLIKRVIGMPGETIVFLRDGVYLEQTDGTLELIDESAYLDERVHTDVPRDGLRFDLQEHEYVVLGDNRTFSAADSRHFGPVHRRFINGKASPALGFENSEASAQAAVWGFFATQTR